MKKVLFILLAGLTTPSFAQLPSYEPQLYLKSIPNEGKPVNYRYLGESRVKYSKRVHRIIDGRQKQNKDITWPRNSLSQVLMRAVTTGYPEIAKPKAYANDSLIRFLTKTEIEEKGGLEYTFRLESPPGSGNFIDTTVLEALSLEKITKFRIMEDWIFDAQHSDLKPRIIAIAPLYTMVSETGVDLGEAALFWVKMDEIRPILAQQEIFNSRNDAARLSYDHWFNMRQFTSYIVKESNVYDVDIAMQQDYRDNGVLALLEGNRIKNDLFVMEHDFWEY
jgi:gliding motility associated protien GldN